MQLLLLNFLKYFLLESTNRERVFLLYLSAAHIFSFKIRNFAASMQFCAAKLSPHSLKLSDFD